MPYLFIILRRIRIVLLVVLVTIGSFVAYDLYKMMGSQGVTGLMVAEPDSPTREIAVLFIGNSYTYYNNLPQIMIDIASSDPDNKTRFIAQAVTRGGYTLENHLDDGRALKILYSRHWDYVVLQEQSVWALSPGSRHSTFMAAEQFNDEIKKIGAHTILFTTWAKKPGSAWYSDPKYSFLGNPYYMQQQFNEQTAILAKKLGVVAIPVGGYWMSILNKRPDFPLYDGDGTHPGVSGSYLAALMFYHYFAGYNPVHATYVPYGMTNEQATFLKNIATW